MKRYGQTAEKRFLPTLPEIWKKVFSTMTHTDEEIWPDCSIGVEEVEQQGSTFNKDFYLAEN